MIYLGIYKNTSKLKFGETGRTVSQRKAEIRREYVKGIKNPKSFEILKVWDNDNKYNKLQRLFIETYIRKGLYNLGFQLFGNDHFIGNRKVVNTIDNLYKQAIKLIEE